MKSCCKASSREKANNKCNLDGLLEKQTAPWKFQHRYQKWPYSKVVTFSKAHHFGYPAVSFSGVKILSLLPGKYHIQPGEKRRENHRVKSALGWLGIWSLQQKRGGLGLKKMGWVAAYKKNSENRLISIQIKGQYGLITFFQSVRVCNILKWWLDIDFSMATLRIVWGKPRTHTHTHTRTHKSPHLTIF